MLLKTMSKISFIKSDDRKYNIERCLSLVKGEILSGLKRAKRIVVKPNCTTDSNKLAATNVEALDALFEFISPYVSSGQITLAEGTGTGDTLTAFKNFGYLDLQEKYDFTIIDLNKDDFDIIRLFDRNGKVWDAEVSKTILESDYLISITPPKTHNEVVYTGAIKNVAVGSLLRPSGNLPAMIAAKMGLIKNNKLSIHQGYPMMNKNIKSLASELPLNLAILDGYEAMEGDGPVDGDMVPAHWAIASSDPIGADWLACQLMGINPKDVGYLSMLSEDEEEKGDYFIIGDDWEKNIISFKMHPDFEKMKRWKS